MKLMLIVILSSNFEKFYMTVYEADAACNQLLKSTQKTGEIKFVQHVGLLYYFVFDFYRFDYLVIRRFS